MKIDIFHVKEDVKSYKYPVIKLIVFIVLFAVIFLSRLYIIGSENEVVDRIIGILCAAILCIDVFCACISFGELSIVKDNQEKEMVLSDRMKTDLMSKSKQFTIDKIVSMAEKNDIIEFQIVSKNKFIKFGASSDYEIGSDFFGKLYYIDDDTFESINDFKSALELYAIDGQIAVTRIDDLDPKYYN